jgi:hypothetical protein
MEVIKKFFPEIMQDNDEKLFLCFTAILESVDEFAKLEITKNPNSYYFRIIPSLPRYINIILEEVLKFFNNFKIKINMGKSIKTTATITFSIEY